MTVIMLLGLALIIVPFAATFVVGCKTIGWKATAGIFGFCIFIFLVITVGVLLLLSGM